jgi:hypothetical protein
MQLGCSRAVPSCIARAPLADAPPTCAHLTQAWHRLSPLAPLVAAAQGATRRRLGSLHSMGSMHSSMGSGCRPSAPWTCGAALGPRWTGAAASIASLLIFVPFSAGMRQLHAYLPYSCKACPQSLPAKFQQILCNGVFAAYAVCLLWTGRSTARAPAPAAGAPLHRLPLWRWADPQAPTSWPLFLPAPPCWPPLPPRCP